MDERLRAVLENPPASDDAIAAAEKALGLTFPAGYAEALRVGNGGEAFIGDGGYLVLWPVEELVQANTELETDLMAPGFVLIGSSGGGQAFGIQRETGHLFEMPMTPLDGPYASRLGETFEAFVEAIGNQTDDED